MRAERRTRRKVAPAKIRRATASTERAFLRSSICLESRGRFGVFGLSRALQHRRLAGVHIRAERAAAVTNGLIASGLRVVKFSVAGRWPFSPRGAAEIIGGDFSRGRRRYTWKILVSNREMSVLYRIHGRSFFDRRKLGPRRFGRTGRRRGLSYKCRLIRRASTFQYQALPRRQSCRLRSW